MPAISTSPTSADLPFIQEDADALQALFSAILESLSRSAAVRNGFNDANATRYLTAIGVTILLYDHLLTLPNEIRLIWPARNSFAKFAFLFNRYLVPAVVLALAHVESGLTQDVYSNATCQSFLLTAFFLGIMSLGLAQVLVLLRVVELWERQTHIVKILAAGFAISFSATFVMMIITMTHLKPIIQFSPIVHMCVLVDRTSLYAGVWVAPMIFEIFVLGMTCLNALSRPREAHSKLTKELYRDGMSFFTALLLLRFLNLLLAIVAPVGLTFLGVIFVWCSTTIILNRSLLRLQYNEIKRKRDSSALDNGRSTPFGFRPGSHLNDLFDDEVEPETHELPVKSAWY